MRQIRAIHLLAVQILCVKKEIQQLRVRARLDISETHISAVDQNV